jgi:O-antigen ligase
VSPTVQSPSLLIRATPFFLGCSVLFLTLINGLSEPSMATLLWRGAVLLTTLGWALRGHSEAWGFTPIRWYVGFLLVMASSAFWATSPCLVWKDVEFRLLHLVLWVIIYDFTRQERYEAFMLLLWRFALGFGLLYGLYQFIFLFPVMRDMAVSLTQGMSETMAQRWLLRARSTEVFGLRLYPNLFGLMAVVAVIYHIEDAWRQRRPYALCMVLFAGLMLCLSASKGSMLVLAVALGFMSLYIIKKIYVWSWTKLVLVCNSLFVVLFLSLSLWFPYVEASVRVRWDYWASAWAMILEHPMGVGAGMFSQWYPQYMTPDATEVKLLHNDHLQVLVEGGWIGYIFYGMFCYTLIQSCFKSPLTTTHLKTFSATALDWKTHGLWLFSLVVLTSLMSSEFMDVDVWPYLWWVGCAVLAVWNLKSPIQRISFKLKWVLGFVFLAHACIDFTFHDPFLLLMFCAVLLPPAKTEFPDRAVTQGSLKGVVGPRASLEILGKKMFAWALVLFCLWSFFYEQKILMWKMQISELNQLSEETLMEELNFLKNDPRAWEWLLQELKRSSKNAAATTWNKKWTLLSLENLCRLKPRSANLWEERARLSQDDLEKLKFLQLAESLHPRQPRYAFSVAEQYEKMGEVGEAKKYFAKALARHCYAMARKNVVWDMELHLLQIEQVHKANARL